MASKRTTIIEKSFKITHVGIIVELYHLENGLPKGTELLSEEHGLIWRVIARVLFNHVSYEHKRFDTELNSCMLTWSRFKNVEKMTESANKIKRQEAENIFQYLLKPINHDNKPEEGDILIIDDRNL